MDTYTFADPELSPRDLTWAWPGYIPRRCMTEGYGEGGTKKGLAVVSLLSLFTTGSPLPDGSRGFDGPVTVISITGEDLLREVMAPRYLAAGADRRHIIDMSKDEDGQPFKLTEAGLTRVREVVCRVNAGEYKLRDGYVLPRFGGLYLDPMMSIAPRNIVANKTFRSVILEPLDAFCFDYDAFCWLMNHTTKDGKTVAGSAAATQGPRMVLGFRQSKANPLCREIFRFKTNITEDTEAAVPYMSEGIDSSLRVRWETDCGRERSGGLGPARLRVVGPQRVPEKYTAPPQPVAPIPPAAEIFRNLQRAASV